MYCKYCGCELPDGSTTCTACGKTLNKAAAAANTLGEKGKKAAAGVLNANGPARYPLWILGLILFSMVLSFNPGAGTAPALGLLAIVPAVMALTGNRKLVPYMVCLEAVLLLLMGVIGAVIGMAASGNWTALFTLILTVATELAVSIPYAYTMILGEKGKDWKWKYLSLVLMGVFLVISMFRSFTFLGVIARLCCIAWRYLMIRWIYETTDLRD